MAKIIIIVLILIYTTPVYAADKWDPTEKLLMGTFILGQTIDAFQTNWINSDDYLIKDGQRYEVWEINPLFDGRSNEQVYLIKGVQTALVYLSAHYLFKHKAERHLFGLIPIHRKSFLIFCNSIVFGCVGHNAILGCKWEF